MCLAQGPQRSDAGEAQTRSPSVSSQALYHWATALPNQAKTGQCVYQILTQILRDKDRNGTNHSQILEPDKKGHLKIRFSDRIKGAF